MKRFVAVFALFAGFIWAGTASAQELSLGAHLGWSNPMGVYENDFGADAAGAKPGYTLGVDAQLPLEMLTDRLSWYSSLSLVDHGTVGSQDRTGGLVDGSFILIPLLTGLRYDIGTLPRLFITAQGGPMFVRGPSEFFPYGINSSGPSLGVQLGYAAGIGLQLSERLSVSAKYFPLGTMDFKYDSDTLSQEVNFLDIQLGVKVF